MQHGVGIAAANDPVRIAPYRAGLNKNASLGYAILGACWHPQSGRARDAAARARHLLGAITAHPVTGHRWPFEIDDDLAHVEAALTDWRR